MVLPMNISSLLMAAIFALSASVQFNDPDWYFWIPLYTCGCLVNLMSCCCPSRFSPRAIQRMGKLALWLGSFLFIKVMVEAYLLGDKKKGFDFEVWWSFDMRERAVREKLGSGLVITSMVLQLAAAAAASDEDQDPAEKKTLQIGTHIDYGIKVVLAVVISCGLSFAFVVFIICSVIMHSASSTVLEDPYPPLLVKLINYVDYGTLFLICLCYVLSNVICVVFVVLSSATTRYGDEYDQKKLKSIQNTRKKLKEDAAYGMAILTGITFGLCGIFHIYHEDEMKF